MNVTFEAKCRGEMTINERHKRCRNENQVKERDINHRTLRDYFLIV